MRRLDENIKRDINALGDQLKRAKNLGHVVRTFSFYDSDRDCMGLEIYLDMKISPQQIRKIVNHIVGHYNFESYYYTKKHAIKVWYISAK